jgi:hypothetical protein
MPKFRLRIFLRTTNSGVAAAWKNGEVAHSANMSTNGLIIRSDRLIIGVTLHAGDDNTAKFGIDHTARGGCFHSMTTSHHVSHVRRVADLVVTPSEYDMMGLRYHLV